jgi:hypothetical protein
MPAWHAYQAALGPAERAEWARAFSGAGSPGSDAGRRSEFWWRMARHFFGESAT